MFGAIAGGLLGGLGGAFGGKKGAKPSQSESFIDPTQAKYLKDKYSQAQDMFNQYKGLNPYERQLMGQGQGMAQQYIGQGNQMMGMGQNMMGMGMQGIQDFMGASTPQVEMNTRNIMNAMENPALQAQIDAAGRDVTRQLGAQHAGTRGAAAASGMVGSSRQGIAEGLASRGAGDRLADISGQMRGQAYQQAFGAEQQRATQQAQMDAQRQMQQGQMAQGMYGSGMQGIQQGMGMGMQGFGLGQQMGGWERQNAFNAMNMYNNAIGQATVLNKSTGATEGKQSKFGSIIGGMLGGASSGMSI
jgi:hypothetical protein